MVASLPAHEDYETPANGATLTTANTWASSYSGTAQTCSTTRAKNGTKSCHIATVTSTTSFQSVLLPSAAGAAWFEFFIYVPTNPGAITYIASALVAGSRIADLRINGDGTIGIRDFNTLVDSSTTVLTAGWYRLAWHVNPGANSQELNLYAVADDPVGSPTEPSLIGTCHNATQTTVDEFRIGVIQAAIFDYYVDYVQVASAEQGSPTPTGGGGGSGGGGAADLLEDFEGAASGTNISTANTGLSAVSTTIPKFSNAQAKSGTRSALLDTTALADTSIMNFTAAAPVGSKWLSIYIRPPSYPSASMIFMTSYNGANRIGGIRLNPAGTISILDNLTAKATSTQVLNLNQWHRISYLVNATGAIQRVRLYLNADVDNAIGSFTAELTATMSGTGQTQVQEFRVGILTALTYSYFVDLMAVSSTEPGPVATGGGSAIVAAPPWHLTMGWPDGSVGFGTVVTALPWFLTLKMPVPPITAGSSGKVQSIVAAVPFKLTLRLPTPTLNFPPDPATFTQTGTAGFRSDFPFDDVIKSIIAPSTRITRRLEIYEADNLTLWDAVDETPRLIDGSVSVDYSRDERRSLDVTLDNADGALKHDPSGFWYDKILKVYRGLEYDDLGTLPRILVIEDNGSRTATYLQSTLGYPKVDVNLSASVLADLYGYDIIVADSYAVTTTKKQLLADAYNSGYAIFTSGLGNGVGEIPYVKTEIAKTTGTWAIDPSTSDYPFAGGWSSNTFTGNTSTGNLPTSVDASATVVGTFTYSATLTIVASIATNPSGGRWFDFHPNQPWTTATPKYLIKKGIDWLFNYQPRRTYETKLGEFYIDKIDTARFPRQVKVTARDGTKKLLGSKFQQAVTFAAGTDLEIIIQAIANNAGISKLLLDTGGVGISSDISFDRTSERWKAISDLCASANLEVFFNAAGYLVTRPYFDPVSSPASMRFLTGAEGNLVDYSKSSNDTRIYNHVVVSAESSDGLSSGLLFYGEAINDEPTSPTRVSQLGDRTYFYTSSFFTSQQQCVDYAQSLLRVTALEEYNLDFSSVVFPWMEVGEIIEFIDPEKGEDEPDRFLLSSLDIPLSLGPMSGNGKRVTIVGSAVGAGG